MGGTGISSMLSTIFDTVSAQNTTIGTVVGGWAAGKAGRYNAEVNETNARLVRANARAAEERQRRFGSKVLGKQRAAVGASGIKMSGSALDALEDSAAELELDALMLRHAGDIAEYGYKATAELDRSRAKMAEINALFGAYSQSTGDLGKIFGGLGGGGSFGIPSGSFGG